MDSLSYKDAGVDIEATDIALRDVARTCRSSHNSAVISKEHDFAGLFRLKDFIADMPDPVLVSGTDGVGTKVLIACEANLYDGLGQDLVAMCANDILTKGALPLFFLDYYASGKLEPQTLNSVVASIARACKSIGCSLIGGETAEMPGLYRAQHLDLAGFCVGLVDQSQIIDGSKIRPSDVIIGLVSSGIHANGFSLVRKIIFDKMNLSLGDKLFADDERPVEQILLEPTKLYINQIKSLLLQKIPIRGMAHITGGGLKDNIPRCLPNGLSAVIDLQSFSPPSIFEFLKENGPVSQDDMLGTFNLGIGFCVVVPKTFANKTLKILTSAEESAMIIGKVRPRASSIIEFVG